LASGVEEVSPQQTIAHYRITAKLGEGGMGAVFRATDTKLKREVSIKVLPDTFAADPDRLARFTREAEVLAALNHPNIAEIYGVEEGALVMELVEGETLTDIVKRGPVPLDTALGYARQIADALEAAHEKGIVHRDLKPANVKVTPEGRVKVLDFGLAKVADAAAAANSDASPTISMAATQAGIILGTAAYMSPEQARGQMVDRRADIWAYGVVLWEMLTGRAMFGGETIGDTLAAVLRAEIDLAPLPAETPAAVRRLLRRCLERDRKKRLPDVGVARLELDEPAEASQAAAQAPPKSSRLPWMAAAVAAAAAIGLGAMWWIASRQVERSLMRFTVELDPEALEAPRITAAISPDGKRLVYSVRTGDGRTQLATRLMDQAKGTLLNGAENGVDPFFSPNGQWIGFGADGKLKKVSVTGGAALPLCDAPGLRGASWGEDGNIFASLNTRSISKVPQAGGTPQEIAKPEGSAYTLRWPQILPGGKSVLYTVHTSGTGFDDANIAVLDLATGKSKIVRSGGYFGRYLPSGHLVYLNKGVLFGIRFNFARLETEGEVAPKLDDVKGNTATAGGQFDFSNSGTFVYLPGATKNDGWVIDWIDRTGKIQPLVATRASYTGVAISPNGKFLALNPFGGDGRYVAIYDPARDTMTRITTQEATGVFWAPDGRHLVYVSSAGLVWARVDGSGEPLLVVSSKGALLPGDFSPDGHWLAYPEGNAQTGFHIRTVPRMAKILERAETMGESSRAERLWENVTRQTWGRVTLCYFCLGMLFPG
jgi:serine/threonine-protein kinase